MKLNGQRMEKVEGPAFKMIDLQRTWKKIKTMSTILTPKAKGCPTTGHTAKTQPAAWL